MQYNRKQKLLLQSNIIYKLPVFSLLGSSGKIHNFAGE